MPPRRASQPQADRYNLRQRRGSRVVPAADERQTGEKAIVHSKVHSRVPRGSRCRQATRAIKVPQRATRAEKATALRTTTQQPEKRVRGETQSSSVTVSPRKRVRFSHGSPDRETNDDGNSAEDDNDLPVMSGAVLARPATPPVSDHPSSAPPDSEDIMEAEEALRQSKERLERLLAKMHETRGTEKASETRISLTMPDSDDIMDEIDRENDFTIEIDLRIYVNQRKVYEQTLQPTSRFFFDLGRYEDTVNDTVASLVKENRYTVLSMTAVVQNIKQRGRVRNHVFRDFSVNEEDRIMKLVDATRANYPRSGVCIRFEIKIECETATAPRTRRSASHPAAESPQTQNEASDASQGPAESPTPRSRRTNQLLEQQETRSSYFTRVQDLGTHYRALIERYRCLDDNCTNRNNLCYPDPLDPKLHYSITAAQHQTWANQINTGRATLENPPASIAQYWRTKQGPASRESRYPLRQDRERGFESAINRFVDIAGKYTEFSMAQKLLSHMDSFHPPPPPPPQPSHPTNHSQGMAYDFTRFRPRSSSPIDPTEDDYEILTAFFDWKINSLSNPDKRRRYERAKEVVLGNDWTIAELKQMEDGVSAMYQRAIQAGVSDGIARGFHTELRRFKEYHRRRREDTRSAAMAQDLAGE